MSISTGPFSPLFFQGIERVFRGEIAADSKPTQTSLPLMPSHQAPQNHLADILDHPLFDDAIRDTQIVGRTYTELLVPGRYVHGLASVHADLLAVSQAETGTRRQVFERALDVLEEERSLRQLLDTYRLALFAG